MNATPRFLQLADVAEVLNISGAQVYALVRRHELKAIKIGGRGQWRVEASELEAYIQRAYADAAQFVRDHPFVEGIAGQGLTPTASSVVSAAGSSAPLEGRHRGVGTACTWPSDGSPTLSSKKSCPTRPMRPSSCWSSQKCTTQGSSAARQPSQHRAQGEPVDHRPGVLAVGLRGEPAQRDDAPMSDDPLRGAVDQQEPVLPQPSQPAAHDSATEQSHPQVLPE